MGPVLARPDALPVALPALPAELTIVIPTLNEAENIEPLLARLEIVLHGIAWEAIFVDDDSRDDTVARLRARSRTDPRVRCIHRIGRRGLSSACVEGILASSAPIVAVMDADLQHDEALLPTMHEALRTESLDVVIGSRYVAGGGVGEWGSGRARISGFATRLSRLIVKADLRDPMSGFFMLRRAAVEPALRRLSGKGFKILLDLLVSSPRPLRFRELPYTFRPRRFGASKLDTMVAWEFLMLLADKLIGPYLPVRFVMFAAVGALGLLAHVALLWCGLRLAHLGFQAAQIGVTALTMVLNFVANNVFTYRDRRLRGWRFLRGLLSFCLVCSVGAVANVGIASLVYGADRVWWLAGVAGAMLGAVWNFAVTSLVTWGERRD